MAGIVREIGLPAPLSLQTARLPAITPAGNASATEANSRAPAPETPNAPLSANTSQTGGVSGQHPASTPPSPSATSAELPSSPAAQIPSADLKPLYDYVLDCKACQAKLAASQSDLADEKSKTAVLTKSRDAALQVAKGGTIMQRTIRVLKWFALGAAAGALAAKTVR